MPPRGALVAYRGGGGLLLANADGEIDASLPWMGRLARIDRGHVFRRPPDGAFIKTMPER